MSAEDEALRRLAEQRMRDAVHELSSSLDRGRPVGLDVGHLLPLVTLLAVGLPGVTSWGLEVLPMGPRLTLRRAAPDLEQVWTAQKTWAWAQLRLAVVGADRLLRGDALRMLAALEQAERSERAKRAAPAADN